MRNIERPSDNVLHNLVYVKKAKPIEIAKYYDVTPRTVYNWIANMQNRQNPEKQNQIKQPARKYPGDAILYDLFFVRKIKAQKIAEKYDTTIGTVYQWTSALRRKYKENPEFKKKMIDEMAKHKNKTKASPKIPKLPKSNAILVQPWGTPIVDESVASDVADNDIRHAMLLDTLHNKLSQKEQEKAVTTESKSKMLPPMQKEITMKETL